MGRVRAGQARQGLECLVASGHLTRDEADEAASTIDMITELVELGALSSAQGSAIVDQLAMDMAQGYRERQQEERAFVA